MQHETRQAGVSVFFYSYGEHRTAFLATKISVKFYAFAWHEMF
jgi:hypothetical protein